MNKGRRQELKQLKYKKRLRQLGLYEESREKNPRGDNYNLTCYKTTGKPCSCYMCSYKKYDRAKVKNGRDMKAIKGIREMSF